MSIQITIRDVSEKVRDELAARAALQGKSMQEYLRAELESVGISPINRFLAGSGAQEKAGLADSHFFQSDTPAP